MEGLHITDIKQGYNKFYIGVNEDHPIAEVSFIPTNDSSITIDHTFVSEELRGQGLGEQLIKKVVEYARNDHKTIIPQCPFAIKVLESNHHFKNIL